MFSVLLVLCCRRILRLRISAAVPGGGPDDYLPHSLTTRDDGWCTRKGSGRCDSGGLLLILFGGVTDRLIPLFAVGAFLAFTLSQVGWWALGEDGVVGGTWHSILVNGLGLWLRDHGAGDRGGEVRRGSLGGGAAVAAACCSWGGCGVIMKRSRWRRR